MIGLQFDTGFSQNGRVAMVAGESLEREVELVKLAALSGCTPLMMDYEKPSDFLLVDLCSKMEGLSHSLIRINHYLQTHGSTALIWSTMQTLEEIYAALPHDHCHILVDAHDVDAIPILVGAFERGSMGRLHDRDREVEFGSLHRISDELAEFARTLARLADPEPKDKVSDKRISFRPAQLDGNLGFSSSKLVPTSAAALNLREIIKLRRLRDRFFKNDLFADPAWDILLDLKVAAQEGQEVSVSSLCIAAAVPPTTALRWITAMTEDGMLVRRQDPTDARRVFIELSAETSAKLDDYFTAVGSRCTSII